MTIPAFSPKDPSDVLDFEINFADWLSTGDTISSVTVAASPSGLTLGNPVLASPAIRLFISSGTAGVSYLVSATVVTAGGRTAQRSARLPVRDL